MSLISVQEVKILPINLKDTVIKNVTVTYNKENPVSLTMRLDSKEYEEVNSLFWSYRQKNMDTSSYISFHRRYYYLFYYVFDSQKNKTNRIFLYNDSGDVFRLLNHELSTSIDINDSNGNVLYTVEKESTNPFYSIKNNEISLLLKTSNKIVKYRSIDGSFFFKSKKQIDIKHLTEQMDLLQNDINEINNVSVTKEEIEEFKNFLKKC